MRVDRVSMTNWMRFLGETTVDLAAEVYGVVGEYDGDARRSNWSGKTAFAEAVRFALYGTHRFEREDAWISHGEPGGGVSVTLSDGTLIQRTRRRGSATKLFVEHAGEHATGPAAQTVIDRLVGLTREDFDVTCWFGQKQLARLVLARPVERFDLVSGWFGLEPLQRCEERTRLVLSDMSAQIGAQEARKTALGMRRTWLTNDWQKVLRDVSAEAFAREDAIREERVFAAEEALRAAEAAAEKFRELERAAEALEEVEEIREAGKRLAAQAEGLKPVATLLVTARTMHDEAKATVASAGADLKAKRALATGQFSGACPVDGSACPVKADINARTADNARLYDGAAAAYDAASKREASLRLEVAESATAERTVTQIDAQLRAMRVRVRNLLPLAKDAEAFVAEDHARRQVALSEAHAAVAAAKEARRAVQAASAEWDRLTIEIGEVDRGLDRLRASEAVARAALRIFGRQGAQRRIAEAALVEIEGGANYILREAAIDLTLKVQWGREGVGLAAWCSECGAPFPASAKVKACERCKAERGPKVVERLDVELSDRSGAAEDLAGAALQLSAAAWLRRERGVSWSVAFIDEPFGALDEAHRRSFGAHLVAMLRGSAGFEQAFIVAHHHDVLDGLPARLLVRAGAVASTVEVA